MEKMSINDFIEDWESVEYYGFDGWSCLESSLKNKAKSFIPKLKFLVKMKIVNGDNTRVILRNVCPLYGNLFNRMRFHLLDKENTYIGSIVPNDDDRSCTIWTITEDDRMGCHCKEDDRMSFHCYESWSSFKRLVKNNPEVLKRCQDLFYRN